MCTSNNQEEHVSKHLYTKTYTLDDHSFRLFDQSVRKGNEGGGTTYHNRGSVGVPKQWSIALTMYVTLMV